MLQRTGMAGILALLAACGGADKEAAGRAPTGAPAPSPAAEPGPQSGAAVTFADQVARGGELYGEHCARCHGDQGQGSDLAPPVVGEGALPLEPHPEWKDRGVEFRTALDVFQFASQRMPDDDPGSLAADEYVAILAFALKANGVELDRPLDADVAAKLVLNKK